MEKNMETPFLRTPETPETSSGAFGEAQIGGAGNMPTIPAFARLPTIPVSTAAQRAAKSPDTVVRWCRERGIGKQLERKSPWRIDPLGLEILMAGDGEALAAYRTGNFDHAAMMTYRERLRRYDAR